MTDGCFMEFEVTKNNCYLRLRQPKLFNRLVKCVQGSIAKHYIGWFSFKIQESIPAFDLGLHSRVQ